ncbi:MAG: helix-turn-helix domain-containing protein [Saprospiraceae bacterium]
MKELGIIERLEAKMDRLTRLVLELQESTGNEVDRVMDVKQAAEYLELSQSGLYQRIRGGSVPFIKNRYGKIIFSEKYLKLANLAPDQRRIEQLTEEMHREFGYKGKWKRP